MNAFRYRGELRMESSDIRLFARLRFWGILALGIAGLGWGTAMYLNKFANASDLQSFQTKIEDNWGKLTDKLDRMSSKIDNQETKFNYLEKDIDYLKMQTFENGKSTYARVKAPPIHGVK